MVKLITAALLLHGATALSLQQALQHSKKHLHAKDRTKQKSHNSLLQFVDNVYDENAQLE